ncbi:MAG: hypothetical protein LAT67_13960 [Balneolales bacterium]|nr:hypothetical protein [Balneolales bacterium]
MSERHSQLLLEAACKVRKYTLDMTFQDFWNSLTIHQKYEIEPGIQ